MIILALDPGTTHTGWCAYDIDKKIPVDFGIVENDRIYGIIDAYGFGTVIEMIASYGMAVGAEVFETCAWIGKFMRHCETKKLPVTRMYRKDVKMHLCGNPRAKDANVRQAIIDKYGGKESTKKGGALHKINSHVWPALGVAITYCKH